MNNTTHNGVKLGLYDTQWMNCVNDPQVLAWDTSKEDAVHRAVALAEKYCIKNAKEAIAAAEKVSVLQQAELDEWRKLRDPQVLHVNLCRGFPAKLTAEQLLHIAGDATQTTVAEPDGYKLVPIEQRQLLEYVSSLEKRLDMMTTLAKQQSMELNLLRIKTGEYKLVEKIK